MQTKGLKFFYVSDLKDYGFTEDCEPFIGEVYSVCAEDVNGNRWMHNVHYNGVTKYMNDFGVGFADNRPAAIAECERLIRRCNAATKLNMMFWEATHPAYGSVAYVEYGAAEELAWEREQG
jgi:hypothetical protein